MRSEKEGGAMDATKIRQCEEKLLRRKDQIRAVLGRIEKETRELTEERELDWLDQARDESEVRLRDQLSEGYLDELGHIQMALGRIPAGGYGFCIACHEPIEARRLEMFPATEFCSGCQATREALAQAR